MYSSMLHKLEPNLADQISQLNPLVLQIQMWNLDPVLSFNFIFFIQKVLDRVELLN